MTQPLTFRSHPRAWQDALPVGNGRSGVLMFGGLAEDRLIVNHGSCWLPLEARRPRPPDLVDGLPAIRQLIRDGQPREAETNWLLRCREAGIRYVGTDSCHPAASLRVACADLGEPVGYRRWLDPKRGMAGSYWRDGDASASAGGDETAASSGWQRQTWVERTLDVAVWQQQSPRPVALTVRLDDADVATAEAWIASTYPGIDPEGWAGTSVPVSDLVTITQHDDGELSWLRGRYQHGPGGWVVAVLAPGAHWQSGQTTLPAATEQQVLIAVTADPNADPAAEPLATRLRAAQQALAQPDHNPGAEHAAWFSGCQVCLEPDEPTTDTVSVPDASPPSAGTGRSVDTLLAAAADGQVPLGLWQAIWDLGRSTFIASSDPTASYPPHLQGIWTGTWQPPWFGCYTNDENVQMMHWQAVAGNLAPLLAPLRRLISASLLAWRRNAEQVFGCRGVLAPLQQGGAMADHQQAEWQGWTGGAGWLARHLWDAWLLSGDRAILTDELLPLLSEVIAFYQDFLVLDAHGVRHAIPSVSVENQPVDWPSRWTIDATMEIAIAREALQHALAAAAAAGTQPDPAWRTLLDQLPGYRVNADGELAEWIHPDHRDQHQHRHLSHLYPVFPGDELATSTSPLRDAAGQAVAARLATGQRSQTGWSLVHLAHIHARLGNGDAAAHCLERMLRTCVQENLLTVHDDWRGQGLTLGSGERERGVLQLDALYGTTSAMLECLIQSEQHHLALLPALPRCWASGSAAGLGSRCGVTVAMRWSNGQATATLTAIRDTQIAMHLAQPVSDTPTTLQLTSGDQHTVAWSFLAD